jgi:putative ABC transport system substrate-binding protein
VNVVRAEARTPTGLDQAFASVNKQRAGAFVMMVDAYFLNEVQRIVMLANKYKLPGVYGFREYAEAGGLISYGLSYRAYYRGVARYVDKVLRGTKPADLPVEQPTKIELVINLVSARNLGLTIPAQMLARADRLIE